MVYKDMVRKSFGFLTMAPAARIDQRSCISMHKNCKKKLCNELYPFNRDNLSIKRF